MKLIFGIAALTGVTMAGGKDPMVQLDKKFQFATDLIANHKDEYPKLIKKDRDAQFAKAKANLARIWSRYVFLAPNIFWSIFFSRCGNDADGNAMEDTKRISDNCCTAINQVAEKLTDWTNTYLATCKNKKRSNAIQKFERMRKNMRRGALCDDDGY